MRISDWSSDVCSSDLAVVFSLLPEASRHGHAGSPALRVCLSQIPNPQSRPSLHEPALADPQALPGPRVGLDGGERERSVGHAVAGGSLAIDGALDPHVPPHPPPAHSHLPPLPPHPLI